MKYAYAGNRQISCNVLKSLMKKGLKPSALIIPDGADASFTEELIAISQLKDHFILKGKEGIKAPENLELLKTLDIDYIFGIHYPYIIPSELLNIPKIGFLNLHPAYLPYNKGWHTPSWAIMDQTPYGATLHFMSEGLDEGAIIHQKRIDIKQHDTTNTLYSRVLKLEEEVFYEALDDLIALQPKKKNQTEAGTAHRKKDLEAIRMIDLQEKIKAEDLLNKLRALTTNDPNELAYIVEDGKKYGIRVEYIPIEK